MKEKIARLLLSGRLHRAANPLARLRPGCVALMYHRVLPEPDTFHPSVSYAEFESDMRFISDNFTPVTLSSLAVDLPRGAIAVTIDDGYREIYDFVYPLSRRMGVPVTVFVVSDLVGTEGMLWTTELAEIIRRADPGTVELNACGGKKYALGNADERRGTLRALKAAVKSSAPSDGEAILDEIRRKLGAFSPGERMMLSWEEIAEMSAACIEFGSHTRSHPILSRVGTAAARDEIFGSKEVIESHLGRKVASFCYPNGQEGDFTKETKNMVQEAGYSVAVTAMPGAVTRSSDRYALRRLWTEGCTRENLYARIYRSLLFPHGH
jgi:peptidoglycan/xylan/chitin deacetylase (PgdA/CDA1 family)